MNTSRLINDFVKASNNKASIENKIKGQTEELQQDLKEQEKQIKAMKIEIMKMKILKMGILKIKKHGNGNHENARSFMKFHEFSPFS